MDFDKFLIKASGIDQQGFNDGDGRVDTSVDLQESNQWIESGELSWIAGGVRSSFINVECIFVSIESSVLFNLSSNLLQDVEQASLRRLENATGH